MAENTTVGVHLVSMVMADASPNHTCMTCDSIDKEYRDEGCVLFRQCSMCEGIACTECVDVNVSFVHACACCHGDFCDTCHSIITAVKGGKCQNCLKECQEPCHWNGNCDGEDGCDIFEDDSNEEGDESR